MYIFTLRRYSLTSSVSSFFVVYFWEGVGWLRPVFRIRTFFSRSGSNFFLSKSRSRSAKNQDPIWKIRIHEKTVQVEKLFISYLLQHSQHTVLFVQVPPKTNQKHHLDPISLFMDGSGSRFLKSGSGSAIKPGSIRIRNTGYGSFLSRDYGGRRGRKGGSYRIVYLVPSLVAE